jgi:hypothetical protein
MMIASKGLNTIKKTIIDMQIIEEAISCSKQINSFPTYEFTSLSIIFVKVAVFALR